MKIDGLVRSLLVAALLAVPASANAAQILFAHVDRNTSYVDDGDGLATMLSNGGHTVTTRFLDTAIYNDYSSFDQVFVYDLYTGLNDNPNQVANYANIANWYNGLSDQNLILDGRIISSYSFWTNRNNDGGGPMSPEDAWIQNYATQLDTRGGGLVLGTDHASPGLDSGVFVDGINSILDGIDVGRFNGYYFPGQLSQAAVDSESPLFLASLDPCRADPTQQCINDNSSTSFVATGLQANGQTLTPVAFHGTVSDAWSNAAVSASMGSPTFGTCGEPGQPPCTPSAIPLPASAWLFATAMLGLAGFGRRRKSA